MTTTTSPVNGNQYFNHVVSMSGQLPTANIIDATVDTLNVGALRGNFICSITGVDPSTSPATIFEGKKLYSVTGNIPNTTTAATPVWLNTATDADSATTVDGGILQLPASAIIVGAYMQDTLNTYAGGNTDVGTESITGSAPAGSTDIFSAATQASIRSGVTVGQVAPTALATTGTSTRSYIQVSSTTSTGVSITPTNVATSTGVYVTIYYLI